MIRYPNLIPECNVDTVFVEAMGYPEPNHAPDINQVCAILENKRPNEKTIGFIDNDKRKPAYLVQFNLVEDLGNVRLGQRILAGISQRRLQSASTPNAGTR